MLFRKIKTLFKLKKILHNIKNKIKKIENFKELITFELKEEESYIKDFNNIIYEYQNKIKKFTFDKKLMNFQLDLLQNFLITTNVIDNWIEYLKQTFENLNKTITLNLLYSVLKIDNINYEVLILWKYIPSDNLKKIIEEEIRKKLNKNNKNLILIYKHEILYSKPFKNENSIFLKDKKFDDLIIKSLIVNEPCIGGIVGVGFDNNDNKLKNNEQIKQIMLENVLTVLMNLIGSVKIISSYIYDINNLATRDVLTNLLNRRVFYEMANTKIKHSLRHDKIFSLLFIDVDNFKIINDNYGHNHGDIFLKNLAKILKENTREEDVVARYGGDEFVIILDNTNIENSKIIVERIQEDLEKFKKNEKLFVPKEITLSIGIVEYPQHGQTIDDLLSISDEMMYRGKYDGKNQIITCNNDMLKELIETNKLKKELVFDAVKNSSLIPFFQKIYNPLDKNDIVYELLMRIEVKNKILEAEEFIDIAESTGLINELDLQLFNKSLEYLKSINYEKKLFINISPKSLMAHNYINNITKIVKNNNFNPENIVFEITERDTVKNMMYLERLIKELITKGFKFAVDDFGSGFSSFIYIKKFNISYLKIDGTFINNITKNKTDLIFVKSMIFMAKELNIKTIAEFVETKEVYELLLELGIDYIQGYYIHKPNSNLIQEDIVRGKIINEK